MLNLAAERFVRTMTLIVLAAICLMACVFFLFVLMQWTRDANRKTITRTAVDDAAGRTNEEKLHIVSPRRNIEKPDSSSGSSRWVHGMGGRSCGCGPGCSECERTAYEKVARSLRSGKRT
jgi:cytoskeletal protein RodZ